MKISNYLKACFVHFPRAQTECLISALRPEFLQGVWRAAGVVAWFDLRRGSSECQFSVGRAPSQPQVGHRLATVWGHFVTILSLSARNAYSQVCQRFHSWATQSADSGPGPMSSQSLWTTPTLPASWSREIVPFVASSYICSHTITIIDLVWNCSPSFYQGLSHTLGNVRNNTFWNGQYRKL